MPFVQVWVGGLAEASDEELREELHRRFRQDGSLHEQIAADLQRAWDQRDESRFQDALADLKKPNRITIRADRIRASYRQAFDA